MEKQVRLTLLQPEGTASELDWTGRLTDAISRLPAVREKLVKVVEFQRNDGWSKTIGGVGFSLGPFTGALSVYSSDVASLKELISTFLQNELKDSPPVCLVGYDEVKINKAPKDPNKPLAKFMRLIMRNQNLTSPQFHSHWSGPHAALFSRQPVPQEKVVIYRQFHTSSEWTEDFAKLGLNMAAYDGVVEIWFETIDDIVSLFGVPESMGALMEDHAFLMNQEESGVMIGIDA